MRYPVSQSGIFCKFRKTLTPAKLTSQVMTIRQTNPSWCHHVAYISDMLQHHHSKTSRNVITMGTYRNDYFLPGTFFICSTRFYWYWVIQWGNMFTNLSVRATLPPSAILNSSSVNLLWFIVTSNFSDSFELTISQFQVIIW